MKNINVSSSSLILLNLIKKGIAHFLCAILVVYVDESCVTLPFNYAGLYKECSTKEVADDFQRTAP